MDLALKKVLFLRTISRASYVSAYLFVTSDRLDSERSQQGGGEGVNSYYYLVSKGSS